MGISIFPSSAAEFVSNNFVVDMNDTSNNTADTGGVKQAGPYSISFSSGDTSFDVYLIDNDGNSVGYSNNTSIVASGLFTTVVILGVAQDEVVSFLYQGSVNNADGEGDEPGAGAYLESITPADLPNIDDTATVIGGNFGADTEIKFESGATVLDAKNITVSSSTELIVTRPDNLDADLDPWTVRAITTGVPEPTGSNVNLLIDEVTAGAVPSWVTTSPLASGTLNTAYTDTLEATDADGDVTYSITSGSLPAGLSLDSATGVISGTPTAVGQTFTATATDDGGNTSTREFTIPIEVATGGTVTTSGGYRYHIFTSSDTFELLTELELEYLVIGGGGQAITSDGGPVGANGGGGGGEIQNGTATSSAGTYSIAVGAGGSNTSQSGGSDSEILGVITAIGGGAGGAMSDTESGFDGGSGGGGSNLELGGEATGTGLGFDGGDGNSSDAASGGGGAGAVGNQASGFTGGDGGNGSNAFSVWATASGLVFDGGYFAGGGGGGTRSGTPGSGGLGGGGNGSNYPDTAESGAANSGGGGGGVGRNAAPASIAGNGGSGVVMIRYEF